MFCQPIILEKGLMSRINKLQMKRIYCIYLLYMYIIIYNFSSYIFSRFTMVIKIISQNKYRADTNKFFKSFKIIK